MGCSESRCLYANEDQISHRLQKLSFRKSLDFPAENEKFTHDTQNFFHVFDQDIMLAIDKVSDGPVNEISEGIKKIYKEFKSNFKKLTFEEVENMILLEISRQYIISRDNEAIGDFEVFGLLLDMVKSHFKIKKAAKIDCISKDELERFEEFLESIEVNFPRKQRVFCFFLEKEYSITRYYKLQIYHHLLFSKEIKYDSIHVYLTPMLFSNDDIAQWIINILRYRQPLNFVSLIIHPIIFDTKRSGGTNSRFIDPYNLDISSFCVMMRMLESIEENNSIKLLALSMTNFSKISIPPEVSDVLLKVISQDKLVGLWLGKFHFSVEFYQGLMKILPKLKKLAFLGLNIENLNSSTISHMCSLLSSNINSRGIALTGMDLCASTDWNIIRSSVEKNKNIELFYHSNTRSDIDTMQPNIDERIHGILI